jgi:hypothetical protein
LTRFNVSALLLSLRTAFFLRRLPEMTRGRSSEMTH